MSLKTRLLAVAAAGLALTLPMSANAHRGWMVPSFTVLSGDGSWVTVDAAISNELFYPDHRAMRLDGVVVTAPDGSISKLQNASTGQYRSTFDVQLNQAGTWKIGSASNSVTASWTENGEIKRFRGSAADFAKAVPAGATDLKTIKGSNRNETYVTRDKPSTDVFKPTGKGLELVPVTHPTDIVATEAATFKFLLDGKPAAGLEVTFVPGGARWRA
ncbi:MAG: nickel transporter, partial [Caulobacter sp. 39-67-4]